MAVAHPVVLRLPITTTMIYLFLGIALGPWWQGVITIDPFLHAPWLEHAAEVAILVSLFTVGMKLRLPLRDRRLRPALVLAFVSMIITAGIVAVAGVWLLHLPFGAAVLLGGILAPTDPVLASDVQTRDPQDRDRLRLTLTVEGGLNDGTAYPVVMLGLGLLGLHDLGEHQWRWWVIDGVWAVVGGLGLGGLLGYGVGKLVVKLNEHRREFATLGEYLVLGLIGTSYGLAVLLQTSGFLAVFAAGVALRAIEGNSEDVGGRVAGPQGASVNHSAGPTAAAAPAYYAVSLLETNEQLERILEVALVLVVGAVVMVAGLARDATWFAPLLFFVIRPVAALPLLLLGRFSRLEFIAIAWFGIRGVGSIYYLLFAIGRGLPANLAGLFVSLTLTIVACSIVAHGVSVTPVLNYYERLRGKK